MASQEAEALVTIMLHFFDVQSNYLICHTGHTILLHIYWKSTPNELNFYLLH
jgi:hypothetical protein